MIIGFTGKKGSGKDTAADYLVTEYGFQKIGYSDMLYEAVCALWGITLDDALRWKNTDRKVTVVGSDFPLVTVTEPMTWRKFLQRFGTAMGREVFGPDFWVEQLVNRYFDQLSDDEFDRAKFVVRDVRFNNEAEAIRDFGGDIWEIQRPDHNEVDHVSEAGIDTHFIRGDIGNDGTIQELHNLLDDWMLAAYGPRHSVSGS